MPFRLQASIDSNQHKGLILLNSITGAPLVTTGLSLTNAQPLHVAIVDGSGSQVTSFGGGTQYLDGGTPPAHPTGPTLEFNNGGTWATVSTATPLPVTASFSPSGTQDVNVTKVGGSTLTIGQQTAANSIPVILPSATITTLTPPSNTGYALDSSLTTIDTDIKNNITLHAGTNLIGKFGIDQTTPGTTNKVSIGTDGIVALAASSAVIGHVITDTGSTTTVTGNVTVTQATGTNLHVVVDSAPSTAVTNTGTFVVQATLAAETTKVIGTVNQGTSPWIAAGGGTAGTAASGVMTVQGIASMTPVQVSQATAASLNATVVGTGTFVVQATLAAETTKVIGVVRAADGSGNLLTSTGNALDVNIKTPATLPVSLATNTPTLQAGSTTTVTQATGTNLHTVVDSGTITAVTAITNALPAGANVIGHVIADSGSTTAVTGTVTTKETKSATDTTATVASSATVVTLIASNANRLGATIYNDSTALLYVKLGATASLTDFTVLLSGQVSSIGGYYEVPFGYTGIITGIWASATGSARVGELT